MIGAKEELTQDTLAYIGSVLLQVQMAEHLIQKVLLFVLQSKDGINTKNFIEEEHILSKKTLGQLTNVLKQRVDLEENFEKTLSTFINDRNIFVHHLASNSFNYGTDTDENASIREFLDSFSLTVDFTMKIFIGLMIDWQNQTGIKTKYDEDIKEYVGKKLLGVSNSIFFSK